MRYDINSSSAIKTVEFDFDAATVGVTFTSSDTLYRYNVSGDYDQVKDSIVETMQDEEKSLGSYINRLIRNDTLQLMNQI